MGYIYKITNIISKKCYIGETKKDNPQLRWNEHKRKIEQGIGCPALQDSVKKYGIENFTFEILIICFDEDRYKLEIEYIKKYNCISPNGYNLTKGGEGGGFHGKKHSQKTIDKISKIMKKKYIDNPELKNQLSIKQKEVMNSPEIKSKIKEGLKNSEKWNIIKNKNKKIQIKNHTEEEKNKLKQITTDYFNSNENIIKHRETMSYLVGLKIIQYDMKNNYINKFISISEASRQTGIAKSSISLAIRKNTNKAGNYIWKKIE
jgi:group I intron endonuclease